MRHVVATIVIVILAQGLAACTQNPVQLASPYDASIDSQAQSLENDFLAFAAERQQNSGTAAGLYANALKTYTSFSARLAVISLRAAADPGGVTCGDAISLANRLHPGIDLTAALQAGNVDPATKVSCVSLEVAQVQAEFTALQKADHDRCLSVSTAPLCATLFPPGTVTDFLPAADAHKAPLVRALIVALDSLVGFEQDLKPATKD